MAAPARAPCRSRPAPAPPVRRQRPPRSRTSAAPAAGSASIWCCSSGSWRWSTCSSRSSSWCCSPSTTRTGRFNYTWVEFSLDAWLHPCAASGICESLGISLKIGLLATIAATIIGTFAAFAMGRHRFRGMAVATVLVFLPMATPEVVAGSSLLTLFINLGMPLGQLTIFIAHVMFCISFVIVTVKARLAGMDPRLEQAAHGPLREPEPDVLAGDLAAGTARASCRPRCCRSRCRSTTSSSRTSTRAQTVTFPMYVWGAYQRALPPQINVIGTAMLVVSLLLVGLGRLISRLRNR